MFTTVFIGREAPMTFNLEEYQKDSLSFGREEDNDIVIPSRFVSKHHGNFVRQDNLWRIIDNDSTNGLVINGSRVKEQFLSSGLKVYVGPPDYPEKIVFVFSASSEENSYQYYNLAVVDHMVIGRLPESDICLSHVGVSRVHAEIVRRQGEFYLRVMGRNGIVHNGKQLFSGEVKLQEMDRFLIMDTQFLFREGELIFYRYQNGLGLDASHVVKVVNSGKRRKTIVNDVSFQIQPGELVAIVGGSGAGKTSLLKCISCCSKITGGNVLIQGEDITTGYESMKRMIGYVPQTDIVYDNLTLERMLLYSAKLRMSQDSSTEEIRRRIDEVIGIVELTGHEQTMIGRLSGGQKKRASIAVELLSDPGVFFLDEPTSGLDPGTERNLMYTLKKMTSNNKTVILVTHTPLNLHLCDKIIFMGYGGNLCFCGGPDEALKFFGVENFVDIYNLVQKDPKGWRERYEQSHQVNIEASKGRGEKQKKNRVSRLRQTGILARRYLEMVLNDRKKLFMQLLMAPGLGLLLYIAFSSSLHPFAVSTDTQTFGLALSCCCFWIGLFQSIQEVCKERTIVEREKMADLKPGAYLGSKLLVLGAVLLLQCILLLLCVWLLVGHPETGVVFSDAPFLEYLVTTYLTALSAAAMGLCVSCIVNSTDQAVAVAPLLLIPQILFAEIICSLSGAAKWLAWAVSCKWSCLAYGASALINELPGGYGESESALWESGSTVDGFINARYDFETPVYAITNPTPLSWLMLFALSVSFVVLAWMAVRRRREM